VILWCLHKAPLRRGPFADPLKPELGGLNERFKTSTAAPLRAIDHPATSKGSRCAIARLAYRSIVSATDHPDHRPSKTSLGPRCAIATPRPLGVSSTQ
jgi:hypothetical protein